ncbi:uncharacterized protein KY384_008638 [Bacidia gigantensis]|uniref:uncharacterized protein n=1 Tax=Bacidia gigantensis TaxID=2732470 RepID=UPI001D04AAE6|nr:uncharacterized protein KY384_008638 [Bacidia gigantensis]KAG8527208.1 hypothetical protein KY384_008638 [Bacidia gigantensis]
MERCSSPPPGAIDFTIPFEPFKRVKAKGQVIGYYDPSSKVACADSYDGLRKFLAHCQGMFDRDSPLVCQVTRDPDYDGTITFFAKYPDTFPRTFHLREEGRFNGKPYKMTIMIASKNGDVMIEQEPDESDETVAPATVS